MDPWIWWIVAAGVLVILDLVTGGSLVLLMVGGGALAGGITAALGAPPALAFAVFAVVTVALLGVVRPVARRHLRQRPRARTGVDALVGAEAVVLEPVSGMDGRVKLGGEVWSARAYDGFSEFEVGQRVQVLQIEGATALVAA